MGRYLLPAAAVQLLAAHAAGPAEGAPRPNIVWVMADDLGWGEPGLYPSTSPHGRIATPHLDQFGQEGIVFTDAYAGYTVCAPSRTTFFTGRHSGRFTQHSWNGQALTVEQNATTVAEVLRRAGYQTGAFGKVAPLVAPLEQGFEAFLGQVDQALCHNMYPQYIDIASGTMNFAMIGNQGNVRPSRDMCMKYPDVYNYTIDVFHAAGMAWLEQAAHKEAPFFLYMSYTVPHAGGWMYTQEGGNPVPSDLQYAHERWKDVEKDHAAVITYLDLKVGDLLQRLKDLGVDDNTLVFFASDNGAHNEGGHDHAFFNSTGGLLGFKRSLYEGGVRSPTMARWPASIAAGQRSSFSWAFWDVLPTLSELAGAPVVGKAGFEDMDGISIAPLLLGRSDEQEEHDYLYFTWSQLRGQYSPGYAVRQGNWKAVVKTCVGDSMQPSMEDSMEIYDLSTDPFETTDVAEKEHELVEKFKQLVISKNVSCMCYQCDYRPGEELDYRPGEELIVI